MKLAPRLGGSTHKRGTQTRILAHTQTYTKHIYIYIYCRALVTWRGVWIGTWICWTLINCNYNYSTPANTRIRYLTTAHAKSSVFTNRCLVTAQNNVLFCWRCRPSTFSQLAHGRNYLMKTTELQLECSYIISARTAKKTSPHSHCLPAVA
jgi:hypothetical protein